MGSVDHPEAYLSQRVSENLQRGKLVEVRSYCFQHQYDPVRKPDGIVALAVAENKLMRDPLTKHINDNFQITPYQLTYGAGPTGSPELRSKLASFVNQTFNAYAPVESNHICLCNGAASAVNNFSFCVGEPGDGILVGRPLYVGFFDDIEASAKLKPVLVSMHGADPMSVDAVQQYERTLIEAQSNGTTIRAILLSNPHNPLGRPYSRIALEAYLKLCDKYKIHLLSDEVYANSYFASDDFPRPPQFNSILSFDLTQYIDPSLVHVIYGMSKDFCANGLRIGAFISRSNEAMLKAFRSISVFSWSSSLAEHVWLNLLSDKDFLDHHLLTMQKGLMNAYNYATRRLKENGVRYNAASVSSFIWIDLAEYLEEDNEDAELALNWRMVKAGVWLSMGASFGSEKHGNYRLTFAIPSDELELGLGRMFNVLDEVKAERESKQQ